MSKKPASLTSDLLARKGEAEPLSIDPSARMSLFAGPDFSPGGGAGRHDDERPQPPEPEIIYTAEETSSGGGSGKLIIGAILGAIVIGGVLLTLSSNTERGVAPVSSNLTAQAPVSTPTPPAAPAAPQAPTSETPAPGATAPQAAPSAPVAPTMPSTPEAPQAIVPTAPSSAAPSTSTPAPSAPVEQPATPALRSGNEAPAAEQAAPAPVEDQAPAAPAKAQKPVSGGAYVVQISALRDEKSAKAAWSHLGKRFPAVLGGHALDIEKAELGEKGTYYRVRAAGFTSKAAAQSACAKLKAGGQDCMVKKR